jgi:hypothetical protein
MITADYEWVKIKKPGERERLRQKYRHFQKEKNKKDIGKRKAADSRKAD